MAGHHPEHRESKPSLLPVITPETYEALRIKYDENLQPTHAWPERLEQLWADVRQNNPLLAEFIDSQLASCRPGLKQQLLDVIVGALAVVDEQLQNDALHRQTDM